jgi:hypothetical protein
MVATKRIVAFGCVVRRLELTKVSRLLVMVENNLLIKFAEF